MPSGEPALGGRREQQQCSRTLATNLNTSTHPLEPTRPGFRLDTDSWVKEYDSCKELAQEIVTLIQVGSKEVGLFFTRSLAARLAQQS